MFSEIYCPIVKSQLPSEWNHETIRPSSVVPQSAPRQCFVETQFNHIIAFGKGCVLLVSDFLLLQPKLLLRPKLDINGGSYIGATKTEIDSTRKETHLLKGQLRQRVILVEKRGKDNQLQSLALRLDKNQHWLQLPQNYPHINSIHPFLILKRAILDWWSNIVLLLTLTSKFKWVEYYLKSWSIVVWKEIAGI